MFSIKYIYRQKQKSLEAYMYVSVSTFYISSKIPAVNYTAMLWIIQLYLL